jgi:hypothetical protein
VTPGKQYWQKFFFSSSLHFAGSFRLLLTVYVFFWRRISWLQLWRRD